MDNEVLLTKADNLMQAKMLVEILQDNGIAAYYKNDSAIQVMEHIAADTQQVQAVYVKEEDLEAAKSLAEAYMRSFCPQENEPAAQEEQEVTSNRGKIHKIVCAVLICGAVAFLGCMVYLIVRNL